MTELQPVPFPAEPFQTNGVDEIAPPVEGVGVAGVSPGIAPAAQSAEVGTVDATADKGVAERVRERLAAKKQQLELGAQKDAVINSLGEAVPPAGMGVLAAPWQAQKAQSDARSDVRAFAQGLLGMLGGFEVYSATSAQRKTLAAMCLQFRRALLEL